MPALQAIRGRIVDARRYINPQVYWRRPPGPMERYELWIRQEDEHERKFTINTRTMPARPGHVVRLLVRLRANTSQVLGLFNASTMDAVNYVRVDPPPLLRVRDFVALPLAFLAIAAWFGDAGMLLFVPAAVAYLLTASVIRAIDRALWRKRVDRALGGSMSEQ